MWNVSHWRQDNNLWNNLIAILNLFLNLLHFKMRFTFYFHTIWKTHFAPGKNVSNTCACSAVIRKKRCSIVSGKCPGCPKMGGENEHEKMPTFQKLYRELKNYMQNTRRMHPQTTKSLHKKCCQSWIISREEGWQSRLNAATERQHGDGYSNWIATAALYSVALSAFVASIYLLTLLGAF